MADNGHKGTGMTSLPHCKSIVLFAMVPVLAALWPQSSRAASPPGFTQLGADSFQRANGSLTSPWVAVTGNPADFRIASDKVTTSDLSADTAYLNSSATWSSNQYSSVVLSNPTASAANHGYGVVVRAQSSSNSYYRLIGSAAGFELARWNNGVGTTISTGTGTTFANGDTLTLGVNGTSLTCLKNLVPFVGCGGTDSTLTGGSPGVAYSSTDSSGAALTSWTAGTFNQLGADAFQRANGALASPWTVVTGNPATLRISSDKVSSSNLSSDTAYLNSSATWPGDQYASVVLSNPSTTAPNHGYGVVVRAQSGSNSYYRLIGSAVGFELALINNGAFSIISTGSGTTFANGDSMTLAIQGTALTCYRNLVAFSGCGGTDGALSAGSPGLGYSSTDSSTSAVAFWSAGSVSSGGTGSTGVKWHPGHYMSSDTIIAGKQQQIDQVHSDITVMNGAGANVVGYALNIAWSQIDTSGNGVYDFSQIDAVLALLASGKKLIINIGTSLGTNDPTEMIPAYMLSNPTYGSSPTAGRYGYWTSFSGGQIDTAVWRPAVAARINALYQALGTRYDADSRVEAIGSLDETAVGVNIDTGSDFSQAAYRTYYQNLYAAALPTMPHTTLGGAQVNYTNGDTSETNAAQSIAMIQDQYAHGVATGWPDTYGNTDGPPTFLSWGQSAFIGHAGGAGFVYAAKMPAIADVQAFGPNTLDYTKSPHDIANFANNTLKVTHLLWWYVDSFTGAQGDWTAASPNGVLAAINGIPISNIACPATYGARGGCDSR
jgi:hypothetical protein